MAAAESSPLTTHVLNTNDGVPGAKMALSLHRLDTKMMIWTMLSVGTTNEDGRCPGLISREAFIPGMYKLRFETASYWEGLGQTSFYPYVERQTETGRVSDLNSAVKLTAAPGDLVSYYGHMVRSSHRRDRRSKENVSAFTLWVVFNISDPGKKFHLPLLMSRFSYSTYRGS